MTKSFHYFLLVDTTVINSVFMSFSLLLMKTPSPRDKKLFCYHFLMWKIQFHIRKWYLLLKTPVSRFSYMVTMWLGL